MTELIIKNGILLAAGLLNLFMAIFVISRGYKNKVNLTFSLLTFFNFLWAISVFFGRVLPSDGWYFWAIFAYPASLGITIALFYFSIYFPFILKGFKKIYHFMILIPGILLAIVSFIPNWFVVNTYHDANITEYTLYYLKPIYLIFALYFFILIILAVYNLYLKHKTSELVYKKQITLLLLTIIIGLIVGSYFDLVLCYFGNFKYIWIGPPFTLLMNAVVFYLIFSARDKIDAKK